MTKEYRVLVVDDAKNIHEDIKIYLDSNLSDEENKLVNLKNKLREGPDNKPDDSIRFTIDDAYQGEEAITMVKNAEKDGNPYALVIMDIVMPPRNGRCSDNQRNMETLPVHRGNHNHGFR